MGKNKDSSPFDYRAALLCTLLVVVGGAFFLSLGVGVLLEEDRGALTTNAAEPRERICQVKSFQIVRPGPAIVAQCCEDGAGCELDQSSREALSEIVRELELKK